MGGWAVLQSPILGNTITLERLIKRGNESMFSYYEKVSLQLNAYPRLSGGNRCIPDPLGLPLGIERYSGSLSA
jgi:hypothetical protein